ncbi:amidase [Eremomyces bilateralis CBS 781.70]|uniref:amidase n=1 Tax=Eremomyces bilateralis CBS 781.70 TaxID=1392243 RepID=A0A6G1G1T8_9PEZI|nr:amidase [Eremomyces bilateralis CBS 781.70]KAF1811890.1 amidase [Eremomyces bilateralis CBS 781.70]
MDWRALAKQKRESTIAQIPKEWVLPTIPPPAEQRDISGVWMHQYLTPEEIEITSSDAEKVVELASAGRWKAVDIASAFCHRAAIAHQVLNCLHEFFPQQALEAARALDEHLTSTGKPKGVLHGLPVSLKDQFHVKGVETTMGYLGWIGTFEGKKGTGKERVHESLMVKDLKDLGAVLYCKTAVPSTLMSGETVNNIIDYCWNSANRNLSSGGSSGGEGALIGAGGSVVGFGTDIGGSIRIPAAFNGLYGLRPSSGRLPYEGMANSMDGQNSILSVVGPLSSTPGGLKLVTKALLGMQPWSYDPMVVELPWREEVGEQVSRRATEDGGLTFAIFWDDGEIRPYPSVRRALEKVKAEIEKKGHQVIEWSPPKSIGAISDIAMGVFMSDGGVDAYNAFALAHEEPAPQLAPIVPTTPRTQATASEVAAMNVTIRELRKELMDYWNSTVSLTKNGRPIDAIISPVSPYPAARREMYTHYAYTSWVNALDWTTVVIPVLRTDKAVDVVDPSFTPRSEAEKLEFENYDLDMYDGAKVGVQLVGRRLQEEKMIEIAAQVSRWVKSASE